MAEAPLTGRGPEKPQHTPRLAEGEFQLLPFAQRWRAWGMKWMFAAMLVATAAMSLAIGLVDTSNVGAAGWAATHTVEP
jgi:hypothetical protein